MGTINWKQLEPLAVQDFVDGSYINCRGKKLIKKFSSRNGEKLYEFQMGSFVGVEKSVASARKTFISGIWRMQSVHQRKGILKKIRNLIEANQEELALLDCLDVGKPIANTLSSDIPLAISCLESYIENMDKLRSPCGLDGSDFAYQIRKPVGVVGAIIGWNYPFLMAILKMGPSLAMGNSLVLKPSEFSPLSACRLAALGLEAGLPPGVFNVVNGSGDVVGSRLANHQDIDLLSFTGSSATGKKMMISAGKSNMKRLMLECGGKSPFIIFDDCPHDLDVVAKAVVDTAFRNQGQWCSAGSRLLVQASIKDRLLPRIIEQAKRLIPKDPLNPNSNYGPLINEAHMNKVLEFIEIGKREGGKLLLGGKRVISNNDNIDYQGYYIAPTIFDQVSPNATIAKKEIFGPVLSVFTFEDEGEAIAQANNSCYGLAAYVATTDLGRAQRLAQQVNSGFLQIMATSSPSAGSVEIGSEPLKQSGFGSEVGVAGLMSYSATSTVHVSS